MGFKLLVDCKKAGHICDKAQYTDAGFWEKARLYLHLAYCNKCQKYTRKNKKLTDLLNDPRCRQMPEECKERIKRELEKELSK